MSKRLPSWPPPEQDPAPRKPRRYAEHSLQAACIRYAHLQYPAMRGHLYAVGNGVPGNGRQGAIRKAEGSLPGVPDLALVWHGTTHYFELKSDTSLSKAQRELHAAWAAQGVTVRVIRDFEHFKRCIENILTNH